MIKKKKKSEDNFWSHLKSQNSKQCSVYVLQWEASHSPKQGDWLHWAPSPEATPHISASSCHSLKPCLEAPVLHLCIFVYVLTSRMCSQVPASLLHAALAYERLPRSALLSDGRETWTRHCRWDLPFTSSRPFSQVIILLLATLWFILPLTHVFLSPYLISMSLHNVEKLDTVLIVCLKASP